MEPRFTVEQGPQAGWELQVAARPKVSLCMMAGGTGPATKRALVDHLPLAVASALPHVDELVLVDTGCPPEAIQKVRVLAGGRITRIVSPWAWDFSKHRNESIAAATGEWCLILDSDELLTPGSATFLANIPDDVGVAAYTATVFSKTVGGRQSEIQQARLFRRGRVSYSGRVHNLPKIHGKIAQGDLTIEHDGYALSPDEMSEKSQRRIRMLREWVGSEPHNVRAMAYLAQALSFSRDTVVDAVVMAVKARQAAFSQVVQRKELPRIYYPLLRGLMILEQFPDVVRYAEEIEAELPDYPDAYYFHAWAMFRLNRYSKIAPVVHGYLAALAAYDEQPSLFSEVLTRGGKGEMETFLQIVEVGCGQD